MESNHCTVGSSDLGYWTDSAEVEAEISETLPDEPETPQDVPHNVKKGGKDHTYSSNRKRRVNPGADISSSVECATEKVIEVPIEDRKTEARN